MFQLVQSQRELFKFYELILPQTVAHILSGDPELERHSAKLWVGQLEGGSGCPADLRSPWRLCPSVRYVPCQYNSTLIMLWLASLSLAHFCTTFTLWMIVRVRATISAFHLCVIILSIHFGLCLGRHPGRPVGEWKDRETLSAGLSMLHLLWEHWEASGVLDLTSRQLLSSWSGGIESLRFDPGFVWMKYCFNYTVTPSTWRKNWIKHKKCKTGVAT